MVKPLLVVALITAGVLVGACGDFAKREECLPTSDPSCVNDPDPTLPDLTGPNPNFPNPAAFRSTVALDETPGKTKLLLSELLLDPVGANAGMQKLELWNSGSSDMDAGNFVLHFGDQSFELPKGAVIPAGGFLVIHIGMAGSDDALNVYAPMLGELTASKGDALLATRDGQLTDYVQWGEPGQSFESAAQAEGQWPEGYACPTPVEGASLCFISNFPGNTPANFTARWPSLGQGND